jgi:hypothetical protein
VVALSGREPEGRYGATLAATDLNGDGYVDLAVGQPAGDGDGFAEAGAVHLYTRLFEVEVDTYAGGADAVIAGDASALGAGSALAALGPLTDDGEAHVLAIGAPGYDTGRGAVLLTAEGRVASGSFSSLAGGLLLTGESDTDAFGSALAAGDADRDSLFDLVVGAPRTGPADGGAVWLVPGTAL